MIIVSLLRIIISMDFEFLYNTIQFCFVDIVKSSLSMVYLVIVDVAVLYGGSVLRFELKSALKSFFHGKSWGSLRDFSAENSP